MNSIINIFVFVVLFIIQIQAQDQTAFTSIFEETLVSSRDDYIVVEFQYGIPSYQVTTSTFSSGTVQSSNSMAIVSSGTGVTGFAQVQSNESVVYHPGHESDCFFTAAFLNGSATSSTQWIGPFNQTDGVAIGFNNTTFSILYRNNGTSTTIAQSSFNVDPLNGTGHSGFTLNTADINVFRIAWGWEASEINFYILSQHNSWILFHTIEKTNTISSPIFSNPQLPITAQVSKTAGATILELATASWNYATQSTNDIAGNRFFTTGVFNAAIGTTESYLISIKNNNTFKSFSNRITVVITLIQTSVPFSQSALLTKASADGFTVFNVYKNATVTGTSFSAVNSNSVVSVSTAGTYSSGTGSLFLTAFSNTSLNNNLLRRSVAPFASSENDLIIELYPGDMLTITAYNLITGLSTFANASINWIEQWA